MTTTTTMRVLGVKSLDTSSAATFAVRTDRGLFVIVADCGGEELIVSPSGDVARLNEMNPVHAALSAACVEHAHALDMA